MKRFFLLLTLCLLTSLPGLCPASESTFSKAAENTEPVAASEETKTDPDSHKPEGGLAPGQDRPWIIKQKKPEKTPASGDAKPVRWKEDPQKKRCEKLAADLKENFLQARYHSIQGDSCTTAQFAGNFLTLMDTCEAECPKEFVEQTGYSQQIVRNLQILQELGTERCLGAKGKKKAGETK
jgi:hypothetical protein